MQQNKYKTKLLVDKGFDFSKLYQEKQLAVRQMLGFDFDINDIVNFIRAQTKNFETDNLAALDLDAEIYAMYERYTKQSGQSTPSSSTQEQPQGASASSNKRTLEIKLRMYKRAFASEPDNRQLKIKIRLIEKELAEVGDDKMAKGGVIATAKKHRKEQHLTTKMDAILSDSDKRALPSGKRVSKESGETYYEYRENRSDRKPSRYPRLAEGGEVEGDEIIMIYVDNYPYYLQKMGDSTHFRMGNNREGTPNAMASHIGQYRGEEFYNDVASWLKGGASPSGKRYKFSKRFANGGAVEPTMVRTQFEEEEFEYAKGGHIEKPFLVSFYITSIEDSHQSELVYAESKREAQYKIADVINLKYGKLMDYEVLDIKEEEGAKYGDGGRVKEAKKRRKAQHLSTSLEDIMKDSSRKAMPKGWRKAKKTGAWYYEARENRTDQRASKFPRLKEGGTVEPTMVRTQFEEEEFEYGNGGKLKVGTYTGEHAVRGGVVKHFEASNGTNIELVLMDAKDSHTGKPIWAIAINGRGLWATENREKAYEFYEEEIEKYQI